MLRIVLSALIVTFSLAAAPLGDKPAENVEVPAEVTIEPGSSRAWAAAACAVPFQVGNFSHQLLSGAASNEKNAATLREMFEKQYKVTRRIELVNHLDKLMENGRQAKFTQAMKQIRELKLTDADVDQFFQEPDRSLMHALVKHSKRMSKEKHGVLAYDCVHYMRLCRFGYGAGYLTEDETWRRLDTMSRKLQKAYTSFEQVGDIYAIGVDVFESEKSKETWAAWEHLKTDEKSPWKSVAWNLKLNPLDKPEPKKPADAATPKK